jgi:ankyrin repeat protein
MSLITDYGNFKLLNRKVVFNMFMSKNMDYIRAHITSDIINIPDDEGYYMLYTACGHAMPEDNGKLISFLLDCGAHINACPKVPYDLTALHLTVVNEKYNCMRILLSRGAAVDSITICKLTPLSYAIRRRNRRAGRLLLDYGARLENVDKSTDVPSWAREFVVGRERARHTGIILMGALKRKRVHRDLIPLIGQWVWSVRGV